MYSGRDDYFTNERKAMVGSMSTPRGGSLLNTIPAYHVYKYLTGRGEPEFDHEKHRKADGSYNYGLIRPGRGAQEFDHEAHRKADGTYNYGLLPPPKFAGKGYGAPVFGGEIPPGGFMVPVDKMMHDLHLYKRAHNLSGRGLPLDHTIHLLEHGAKHGTKGGFLPFAALLPLLGSAAAALGPAAAGAATTYGLGKLFGNGLPPLQYHKGSNSYILHGSGWKDVFKSLLKRAGIFAKGMWKSHGKDIARAGAKHVTAKAKEALDKAAQSMLKKYIPEDEEEAVEPEAADEAADADMASEGGLEGLGLKRRRNTYNHRSNKRYRY